MLKVGIIGTGVIFDLNVLGYLNNDEVKITCLCDKDTKKVEQKIEKFKLTDEISIYSDFKEMINNEELDIVDILLPHHLHAEAVIYSTKMRIKGISVQKARWGRFNIVKGKTKIELPKDTDVKNMTLTDVEKIIENQKPVKKPKKKK